MKTIAIESQFLYKYDEPERGITVGGTQRYAVELGKLFLDLGWNVVFLTKANKFHIEETFFGKIVALNVPYGTKGNKKFSEEVYKYCLHNNVDLVCYSDLPVAFHKCFENSFALQHGIGWDNPHKYIHILLSKIMHKRLIKKFKKIICVDTNFINWCREKYKAYFDNPSTLVFIPNFADESQFLYRYKEFDEKETKILLYPRRLSEMRGYDLFVDACIRLKNDGYNIKPVLAYEDFKDEEFLKRYPNYKDYGIEIAHPKMSEIQELYYNSFVSFVPTRWSEGTSLSAIESISCGCPVIGTYVGGIPNVILPGFNGDLVSPTVEDIYKATKKLLDNVTLRNQMAANCLKMNAVFGIKRWRERVLDAIADMI